MHCTCQVLREKTVKVSGTSILTTVDHLSILPLKSANQQARDVHA